MSIGMLHSHNGMDVDFLRSVKSIDQSLKIVAKTKTEIIEAGNNLDRLIISAQDRIRDYIVPDSGISEHELVNNLIGIFDGPDQRMVQDAWEKVRS